MAQTAIHINEDQAFEFYNGQDLCSGSVGTWFSVRADDLLSSYNHQSSDVSVTETLAPFREKTILLVRTQSCGAGWFQVHPLEE